MSCTQAAFNVHRFFQNVIPTPYFVNAGKNALVPHPLYQTRKRQRLRWLVILLNIVGLPTTLVYLVWLLLRWNPQENNYILHVLYYTVLSTILIIFSHNFYTVIFKSCNEQFVITQTRKLTLENGLISSDLEAKYISTRELFVYNIAASLAFVVIGLASTPFTGDFDPLQLLLGSSFFPKVACCVIYAYSIGLQAWYLCSTLLLLISFVEMIERYTSTLVLWKSAQGVQMETSLLSEKFRNRCKRYQISRLLFISENEYYADFSVLLISVGILLGSVGTPGMIKLYSVIPTVTYLSLPAISFLAFGIALVGTYMSGMPYNNAIRFQNFWKLHVRKRYDRKLLTTCQAFGIDNGPYGVSKANVGLQICDDIVNNAVTFLLLF